MESSLRARIAALAEAEPALADDLVLRGALIEIVDFSAIELPELRLPADLVRARLSAGTPLLDRLDLPIPASTATLLERLTVAMLAAPDTREPAEAMLLALREHRLHAEQLVGEAVVSHDDHLTALAASAGTPDRLVITVADLAARALLSTVAVRLRPALALAAWDRDYCPICGGLPVLAERTVTASPLPRTGDDVGAADGRAAQRVGAADGRAAQRLGVGNSPVRLRCGRCASAWARTLQLCPDCNSGAFTAIDAVEDLGGWQIAACETCPEYLKIAPSPRSERLADLLVDDLESWHLDRWALEYGLQRRAGPGYRLEHGEVAGEDLDED